MTIKSLIIHGKQWTDRLNGTTYQSARATVNFGISNVANPPKVVCCPMESGYDNYYKQMAMERFIIKPFSIPIYSVLETVTKAECKAWGESNG